MKKKFIFLVATLILSTNYTYAAKSDGNVWINLKINEKRAVIMGFIEGLAVGNMFSTTYLGKDADLATKSFEISYNDYIKNKTPQQFIDGLDWFYSDFSNRSILMRYGLLIVFKKIYGASEEDIKEMIKISKKESMSGE